MPLPRIVQRRCLFALHWRWLPLAHLRTMTTLLGSLRSRMVPTLRGLPPRRRCPETAHEVRHRRFLIDRARERGGSVAVVHAPSPKRPRRHPILSPIHVYPRPAKCPAGVKKSPLPVLWPWQCLPAQIDGGAAGVGDSRRGEQRLGRRVVFPRLRLAVRSANTARCPQIPRHEGGSC